MTEGSRRNVVSAMEVGSGSRMESIIKTPTIQATQDHDRNQVPSDDNTKDLELASLSF